MLAYKTRRRLAMLALVVGLQGRFDEAAKLAQQGISVHLGTPAQAQAFVDRQLDTWGKVVRDNGITPD